MAVLIIADHNHQDLNPACAKLVSAALEMGGDIDILVMGHQCDDIAKQAATLSKIRKVICADAALLEKDLAESQADVILKIADQYSHILSAATTMGKNLMPRLAALCDVAQISEISKVINDKEFERPIYAGNAIQHVQSKDDKKIITVRVSSFSSVEGGGSAPIEPLDVADIENHLSQYVSEELTKSDRPELTSAKIVISGGRGMQSGDNFVLLEKIADKIGAAIGASRAAVDAGYVPNDYQVGQTGKTVAPELYIAVGISGAIQHLAGMKDSKFIVAINKDEDAPIMQIADYGWVADLFTAIPELEKELTKAGY